MIFEVSVGLKEICDSRRLSLKILYINLLSERKFGNTSSLDEFC